MILFPRNHLVAGAIAALASAPLHAAAPAYDLQVLENLGGVPGVRSLANGVSTVSGVPFGRSIARGTQAAAVQWEGTKPQKLSSSGKLSYEALAMSPSLGVAAGSSWNSAGFNQAVAWNWEGTPGPITLKPLEAGATSVARGVNDRGVVVGSTRKVTDNTIAAVSWKLPGTKAVALQQPPGTINSEAVVVNNAGVIAGVGARGNEGFALKWSSRSAAPEVLPQLGTSASVLSINKSGVIVGWTTKSIEGVFPVKWESDGRLVELTPVGSPGDAVMPTSINDKGDIVGFAGGSAVLWQGEAAWLLDDLLTPEAKALGLKVTWATGIDNAGRITAVAEGFVDGTYGGFPVILTPAP